MADERVGLHSLKPARGSRKARKRVGRGEGSGVGKTSGRGHKGAGARSGNRKRVRFEGGQTPIHMRMRKLRGLSVNAVLGLSGKEEAAAQVAETIDGAPAEAGEATDAPAAEADADHVLLVADDDQRGEREAPAALDDLRDAVDLDDPLLQVQAGRADGPVDAVHTVSPPSRTPSANALTLPWYW